jgi:hypothetical protein
MSHSACHALHVTLCMSHSACHTLLVTLCMSHSAWQTGYWVRSVCGGLFPHSKWRRHSLQGVTAASLCQSLSTGCDYNTRRSNTWPAVNISAGCSLRSAEGQVLTKYVCSFCMQYAVFVCSFCLQHITKLCLHILKRGGNPSQSSLCDQFCVTIFEGIV